MLKTQLSLFVVVGLPIGLFYILFFVRLMERKIYRTMEDPDNPLFFRMPIISLRDAALVALALDFAELLQVFQEPSLGFGGAPQAYRLTLLTILFFLHIGILFTGLYTERHIGQIEYLKRSSYLKLMHMYMALAVLLTNAVTIQHLLGLVGGIK